MDGVARRKIQMGQRALAFSTAHPDTEPGAAVLVSRLEQLVARAEDLAAAQRQGMIGVHAAAARKRDLRRAILALPIAHLARVGEAPAAEQPSLAGSFGRRPAAGSYLAFRTAAGTMLTAAQAHREVLVKHGGSDSVLGQFARMLEQFDEAVTLGNESRAAHMGATRDLKVVSRAITRTVGMMDGRNRERFQDNADLLGQWLSASAIVGAPRSARGETPAPSEARPAA